MRWVAAYALAVMVLASPAAAQELFEPDEQGLTLNIGYAPGFCGAGGGVGFTASLAPDIHIMPHVGVGVLTAKRIHDNRDTKVLWGPGGGVLLMHGGRHRLVLDVTFGIVDKEVFVLHGYYAGARAIWGVGTLLGYAYVTQRGFIVRGEIGPTFATTPYTAGDHVGLQAGLVVGYTFR